VTIPIVEHTLDNGLRVVVSEDHIAPIVAVNVWYDVGSRHEQPGLTGLAHLFEHLMFEGSANVGSIEHFSLLQEVGASLNGTTWFDRTNYFETVPVHAFELALWLEADRMGTLLAALTQESLDNQRDVVKNERRQSYDNQPYGTSWENLFEMLYPEGHPYHHLPIGSMADLDAASLDDCRAFFSTHYAPDNAVLGIAGDVTPDGAIEAVERYFGVIPPGPGAPDAPDGTIGPLDEEVRRVLDEEVPNEAVYQQYRCDPEGTPGADAAQVALHVLAGGSASRLHQRLVRDEELAISLDGGHQGTVGGTGPGVLVVHARSGASLDAIEAIIDEELEALGIDGPGDEEVARAKASLERSWLEHTDAVMGRADELCRHATLFGDAERINTELDRLHAVTGEAVQDIAARHLVPTNRAVLRYEVAA